MKILIIDNWTQGIKNLEKFFQGIPNIKIKLIHFENKYLEKEKKSIKSRHIRAIDVSKNIINPYQILKKEKPDLLVLQEIISLPLISFNIAAKNLKIKTFHITHGIPGNLETKYDFIKLVSKVFRVFKRNIFYFYPIFFLTAINSKDFVNNLKNFFYMIYFQISRNSEILKKIDCLETDYAFVYNTRQKKYFENYLNIKKNNIIITGYIPLKNIQNKKNIVTKKDNIVVYFATSVYQEIFKNEEEYVLFLKKTSDFFEKNKLIFIVKLREISYHKSISKKLLKKGIKFIFDKNTLQVIANSKLVISEPTTYFYIATLFNKPIILNQLYPFNELEFSKYLTDYPYSKKFKQLNIIQIYKFIKSKNLNKINNWKNNNLKKVDYTSLVKKILINLN